MTYSCLITVYICPCIFSSWKNPEEETLYKTCRNSHQINTLSPLKVSAFVFHILQVDTLYETCQKSLQQNNDNKSPALKVHVHLDCTRGSRGEHNSRTMLLPLLKDFPGATSVSLYHTPDLRGMLKRYIPERFNEIIGLSHIKAYVFDDTVIMSGWVKYYVTEFQGPRIFFF